MKRILIILSVILLGVVVHFSDSFLRSSKGTNSKKVFELKDFEEGVKSALLHVKLLGLEGSEISKNFVTNFATSVESLNSEEDKIFLNVEILGGEGSRSFKEVADEVVSLKTTSLLVLSPDVFLTPESKSVIEKNKITTILFSSDAEVICEKGKLSNYIWNFGIPTESYTETFLSFINQKFSKLAQDLRIFVFANDKPKLQAEAELFVDEIRDLGLVVAGKVFVDDRIENIYPTLRQIYDYDPKVIIASVSRKGLHTFMPIASRLGFTYDLALTFSNEVYEEDLVKIGEPSKGVFLPTAYVSDLNPGNGVHLTAAGYQGKLVSGILEKLYFRGLTPNMSSEEISKAMLSLDGVRYSGLSGLVSVDARTRGLIQPLHIGEFRENSLKHVQYLGDVSLPPTGICQ